MNNDSEISIVSDSSPKIKCHSSNQLFCRGDICFIEYTEIAPTKTEYGCIIFEKNLDHKCNKTIDFIHRECCSTIFCNSRLFNYDIYHRQRSLLNNSSIDENYLSLPRLQIILNIIIALMLFSLLCGIIIYLLKRRIKSRKLQPSIPIQNNNIIHSPPFSIEEYSLNH